jgi:hypothetical protein
MRFIWLILLLGTVSAFGQNSQERCRAEIDTLTKQSVYRAADEMANFPGGMEALMKQVAKRVFLREAGRTQDCCKVFVAFVVQSDGTVVGQRVVKNTTGTDLAEQCLDIIDDVRWQPGVCNGKTVATIEIYPFEMKMAN